MTRFRTCKEKAAELALTVGENLIFSDDAQSGRLRRRACYQALIQAMRDGRVKSLIVMATSRLNRKQHQTLSLIAEQIEPRKIRFIEIARGIDSVANPKQWKLLLSVLSMVDELQAGMYIDHIRAGHEGLLAQAMVYGTMAFGYRGEPIKGAFTPRGKQQRLLMIDEEQAVWVKRIFGWFLQDRLGIYEIVRRLNDMGAPPPPRSISGKWTYTAMSRLLRNPRYRGQFDYGATESIWQELPDYNRQVPTEQPRKTMQFEYLRIIDDATWYAAQELREKQARRPKTRNTKPSKNAPPPVLNGLLVCGHCGRRLVSAGGYGKRAHCPDCREWPDGLFTQVNKRAATRALCKKLVELVRADEDLVASVIATFERHAAGIQQPDTAVLDRIERDLKAIEQKIAFILDAPGDTSEDMQENRERLRGFRGERAGLQAEKARLDALARSSVRVPSPKEVQHVLDEAANELAQAAEGKRADDVTRVRRLIELLTGGEVLVEQRGERKPGRGWVKLRFACQPAGLWNEPGVVPLGDESLVEIELRERPQHEAIADELMTLAEQGVAYNVIATRLGCNRGTVTKAVHHWHRARGLPAPDGRSNRRRPAKPRIAETIIDEVPIKQIAEQLGVGRNMVAEALKLGYARQGLPVPDGRALRKQRNTRRRRRAG